MVLVPIQPQNTLTLKTDSPTDKKETTRSKTTTNKGLKNMSNFDIIRLRDQIKKEDQQHKREAEIKKRRDRYQKKKLAELKEQLRKIPRGFRDMHMAGLDDEDPDAIQFEHFVDEGLSLGKIC